MEIIKIQTTENGTQTVLATDLYKILEPKTQFNKWIIRMLDFGFVEKVDFWTFLTESIGGRPTKEFILTLDCAKSIAMVQRSAKGKQIRAYFIEVEKGFKAIATPQQIQSLYTRLVALENKQIDYADDWAIDRYLRVNKLFTELTKTDRQQLGKLCTKAHKEQYNTIPKKVPHPSYINGQNVYPYELINNVFKQWKGK